MKMPISCSRKITSDLSSSFQSYMKNIHSVVLAAGLSRRMNSKHTNKVCLELLGKPVIVRAVEALENAGISSHTVVLGASADKVLQLLSGRFAHTSYALQSRQSGPADALASAVNSLPRTVADDTLLLVVPGHRIIAAEIIEKLVDFYHRSAVKFAGLQLVDDQGNVRQMLSIYLGKLGDIRRGLKELYQQQDFSGENEVQLAGLAEIMNPPDKQYILPVTDFSLVMGFNNPEEFLEVAGLLSEKNCGTPEKTDPTEYHTVKSWLTALAQNTGNSLQSKINELYGNDQSVMMRQKKRLQELLECAGERWGDDAAVSVIRSPGRVNIMGRHVDHQGGNCNLMTIGSETLMAAKLRSDDRVTLYNLNKEFAPAEFSIGELVQDLPWDDWQTLVGSKKLARLLKQYGVNWADYIKAVFLRFQKHFDHKKLHGMDMIVSGNVPMAAGLSSSSTLVVGAAEALIGANRLDLEPDKLVTLCGEGEWFVGTRGGAADHAAVKLGECNKVVKVGFFDFAIEKLVNFPEDHALIVCDSQIQARKSGNAKDQFNHRVSCYRIGLLLLKKFFPQYRANLHHLRDFTCEKLNIPLDWFYKLLTALPEYATRSELEKLLPQTDLQQFWSNHNPPADGLYPIRGVVLYGLAECARSAGFVDALENNIALAGKMMNISHNGDRVKCFDGNGCELGDYFFDTSDQALEKLINNIRSGDPEKIAASALWRQPGSYRCSLPEIDLMVDIALSVPGVAGAQLAGAGLGGCMMVLAHNSAVAELTRVLEKKYYIPRDLPPTLLHCRPIAGACSVKWQE